jgi:hypothetical protein
VSQEDDGMELSDFNQNGIENNEVASKYGKHAPNFLLVKNLKDQSSDNNSQGTQGKIKNTSTIHSKRMSLFSINTFLKKSPKNFLEF